MRKITSVRRIRRAVGLSSPQRRRAPHHRSRRERMPQAGQLLQVDGSRHQWFGPDGLWLTLVWAIDDATGDVPYANDREQEGAQGYFLLLREVVRKRGFRLALSSDRHKNLPVRIERAADPAVRTSQRLSFVPSCRQPP